MLFIKICFVWFLGLQFLMANEIAHYKVILVWMDKTSDLDAKIVSEETIQSKEHIQSSYDKQFEIITIPEITKKFIFLVQDYSNIKDSTSTKFSNSKAMVFVYKEDELIKTYETKTTAIGNEWIVFGISKDGSFEEYNLYTEASNPKNMSYEGLQIKTTQLLQNQNRASVLNKNGEAAYKNNQHEEAIEAYKKAIGFSPYNGEVFCNLGLVYAKLDMTKEAIWASKKAILYASSKTTVANAYYNLGRIYENMAQNFEALENYQQAWNLTKNISYQKAIKRVQEKLENEDNR